MVEENLTDEQQADLIRQWFRENGMYIAGGIGLGLLSLFGWDQWQVSQTRQAEQASSIYEELVGKIQVNNEAAADSLLQELIVDHGESPYVDQARLRLAKMSLERNDFESGAAHLEAVVAGSGSREIRQIATLRLARVRLQQERYEAALAALEAVDTDSAFYPRANEVRGDVLQAMGRGQEALDAYEAALTDVRQPPPIDRAWVTAKRDDLSARISNDATVADDASAEAAD